MIGRKNEPEELLRRYERIRKHLPGNVCSTRMTPSPAMTGRGLLRHAPRCEAMAAGHKQAAMFHATFIEPIVDAIDGCEVPVLIDKQFCVISAIQRMIAFLNPL
ncbi:MAG: hypothetical protein IJ083_14950 [Clostridia bacterium]|nr:hypothetical protein [Clostridia bacterium]